MAYSGHSLRRDLAVVHGAAGRHRTSSLAQLGMQPFAAVSAPLASGQQRLKRMHRCVASSRQGNSALTPSLLQKMPAAVPLQAALFPCRNHFELGPGGETGLA